MATKHWGEIPVVLDEDPEISIIANIEPRPVDVIGAKLFPLCPSSPELPFYVDDAIPCRKMLHSIQLIAYKKKVASLMLDLQKLKKRDYAHDKSEKGNSQKFPQTPPIPDAPPLMSQELLKRNSACFAEGEEEAPIPIPSNIAWKILRKAVACICAHAGYDVTASSTLNFLTNVTEAYIKSVCKSVSFHAYDKSCPEPTIFPDALEHTCLDMNKGSMTSLLDFYNRSVVQYHRKLQKDCVQMLNKYEKFKVYRPKPIEEKEREQDKKKQKLEKKVVPKIKKDSKSEVETSEVPQKEEKSQKMKKESKSESSASSKSEKTVEHSSKPCKRKSSVGPTKKSDNDKKDLNIHDPSMPSTSAHVCQPTMIVPKLEHSSPERNADNSRSAKAPRKRRKK